MLSFDELDLGHNPTKATGHGSPEKQKKWMTESELQHIAGTSDSEFAQRIPLRTRKTLERLEELQKVLSLPKTQTLISENGNVVLDTRGYKANPEDSERFEELMKLIAIDITDGTTSVDNAQQDLHGNLWIYASEGRHDSASSTEADALDHNFPDVFVCFFYIDLI